ncbi:MAG: XRE family transcriptional regulator [Sorangiineae bacterium PRO1]|nr:XRE family transcriptional regulator [Sorangiineae bacterium PRO1]
MRLGSYNFASNVRGEDVDFAALVRSLRAARRETQEEFARELDVTVGTLSGWENGKHVPVRAQRRRLLALAAKLSARSAPVTVRRTAATRRGATG